MYILYCVIMGKIVKLRNMDAQPYVIAGISSLGTIIVGLIASIIRQAIRNTEFDERLKKLEEEHEDIREIKETVTDIRIENERYYTLLEENQAQIKSVAESTQRIHDRLDFAK